MPVSLEFHTHHQWKIPDRWTDGKRHISAHHALTQVGSKKATRRVTSTPLSLYYKVH